MKAAAASGGVQNLVFSKWTEIKHKAEPNNYIEFFLVTDTGNEVLAITAEDHGNSHYVYQSTGAFTKYGALNSKNRADTISWLEMIIKESQIKVDSQLAEEMAHAGEPTPDNPLGLYYTQHKAEKTANPDGTHTQRFFLLDQHGVWHLAVVGEERETRDGHYLYKATEEFATRYPLSCHSQKDVIHWLEQRVTHNRTPPPPMQQRRADGSGGAPSAGAADVWGPAGPGVPVGVGYFSATTPTSAADGMVGGDGAGPPQGGDSSHRQLSPPPVAAAPGPQAPGLAVLPVAAASGGAPGLLQQPQQAFGPPPTAPYCGVQPAAGAAQGSGEAPSPALQALDNVPACASCAPPSTLMPYHVGVRPSQAGQHQGGAQSPVLALPHPQQQLSQNGAQQPPVGTHQHLVQQPAPGLFADSSGHAATASAAAPAPATGPSSELAPLPLQQQQLGAMAAPLPTISHLQQEAGSHSVSVAPPQPQPQQQQSQQQLQFPMLIDTPLQMQQQLSQGQSGGQAGAQVESQGLAQLLGLAGLASSMSAGGVAPQLSSNGPPLQLQLPMPPQLQLQGSSISQLSTPLQQQPSQQQFMLPPNLFQQQQQQPLLPLQPFSAQMQLHQEHQLQLLQKQIQQQQQQLQQLLQSGPGALALNNTGGQQQQQLQIPGFMGVGGVQLPPPGTLLQLTGSTLKALPALASGGQAWNAGGGPTPATSNAPVQSTEGSAVVLPPGQMVMPAAMQLPGLLSRDLPAGAVGAGLNALGAAPAVLAGPVSGSSFGQAPRPAAQPLGTAGSSDTAVMQTFGGPSTGGGVGAAGSTGLQGPDQVGGSSVVGSGPSFGRGAWPTGLATATHTGSFAPVGNLLPSHPRLHPQQPQQQTYGQSGDGLYEGSPAGNIGGVDAPGGSGRATGPSLELHNGGGSTLLGFGGGVTGMGPTDTGTGAGAAHASSTLGLPGGFGAPCGASGSAAAGSATAAAAGCTLPQPFAAAGSQSMAPGMLLSAVRSKEAGPGAGYHGGRGGTGGRGSGGKHKLAGVAEVAHKRKLARLAAAGEEAVRLAQGAYLASLRHQALSEAAQQEALRKTIASWVRGQVSDDELSVSGWHESLEQMLRDANRSRTVTVPFLANERLTDVTRSSAEAITLAAAVSLAAPYDSAAQPRIPAPPAAAATPPPPVPAPMPLAAAVGNAPASASSFPSPAACGGASEGGAGGGLGAGAAPNQPAKDVPSSAEQMAALSSLKALLEGNLTAAVLGPAAPATTADGLQQAEGSSTGATVEPVLMDADRRASRAGKDGLGARAEQPTEDIRMDDVAGAATTPFDTPIAATAASGAAAPQAAGHPLTSDQPPPPAPLQASAAPVPPPAQHLQPLTAVSLPAVPQRPSGPVGAAAVLACAGSAKSWSFVDPHMNRHGVRIALESLREVAALCLPVASMASSKLVETVKQYESHPHPSVSGLAKEILKRWRGSLIHRLRSMSDSRCYQDPVAALESKIQANEIVFPNLNELLGMSRGSSTAVADGVPPAGASQVAAGLPYTPSGAAPAGACGSFGFAGSSAYSLTATPTAAGGGHGLAALPVTPSLSLTAAGTPALTTVGATSTFAAAITPGGGPGASLAASTTTETPRGLFDAAVAQGTTGAGSFPTPELFSRPNGASAALSLPDSGVPPLVLPALAAQPDAPVLPPMSPPTAGAAAAPPAALAPQPLSPATAVLSLQQQQPAAVNPPSPSPAVAVPPPRPPAAVAVAPPPSPAPEAALPPLQTAAVQTAAGTAVAEAAALANQPAGPPQQQPPPTPGQPPVIAPQPPSPAPPPLQALAAGNAGPAPVPAAAEAPAQAPTAAPGPELAASAALLPMPAPVKAPIAAQAALAPALLPSPAKSMAAAGLAVAAGPATWAGPVAAPAVIAPEPAGALPPPSSARTPGIVASAAASAFGALSPRLPGLPTPTQATTAEVAALLAASAQSLAAHIQATAAAGGSGVAPPPPTFSPAQLSQLGALASTTKVYASALKSSDAAVAASALQNMVQQLRQAHALNLGLGASSLGGLPQRLLFLPSPSTLAGASAASPAQQTLLPASWPSVNRACGLQPPQAPTLMQPTPSSGQPQVAGPASQVPAPAQKEGMLSQEPNAAAPAGQETKMKAPSVTTPGIGGQSGVVATQAEAAARDAAGPAGAPPLAKGLAADAAPQGAAGNLMPSLLGAAADTASAPSVGVHESGLQAAAGGAAVTGHEASVGMEVDGAGGAAAGGPGP